MLKPSLSCPPPLPSAPLARRRPGLVRVLLLCAALPWLGGCEHLGLAGMPLGARWSSLPELQQAPAAKAVVNTIDNQPDIQIAAGTAEFFVIRPFGPSASTQTLPERRIGNLSFSESGVYDAMVLLLEGSGFALSIDSSTRGSERANATSLFNLSGSLSDVLVRIAEQSGLFFQVRDNTVVLSAEAQFVIDLPPLMAADSLASVSRSLQHLGARDVHVDSLNRTVVFKTHQASLVGIRDYLGSLRERRALLVYDVHVYRVDLSGHRTQGIAWNAFTGAAAATPQDRSVVVNEAGGAVPMGAVLSDSPLKLDALQHFLQSQGDVKALARPRIALVSGGRGHVRVGQSTTYVSKVGGSTTGALPQQVSVETQTLHTGVELTLNADIQDGMVYTRIELNLSDILKYDQVNALGTQLNLPQTANREVKTTVKSRPGDIILLGGIWVAKDAGKQPQGLAGWLLPAEMQRSELVLALKPRVLPFAQAISTGMPESVPMINRPEPVVEAPRTVSAAADNPPRPSWRGLLDDWVARVSGRQADGPVRPLTPGGQP